MVLWRGISVPKLRHHGLPKLSHRESGVPRRWARTDQGATRRATSTTTTKMVKEGCRKGRVQWRRPDNDGNNGPRGRRKAATKRNPKLMEVNFRCQHLRGTNSGVDMTLLTDANKTC